jgi:hypothetical protein
MLTQGEGLKEQARVGTAALGRPGERSSQGLVEFIRALD